MIPHETLFCVLKKYKTDIFENGLLRGLSHDIWSTLSKELKNKIPKKHIYIYVLQNRHNFQTNLKKLLGIKVSDEDQDDEVNRASSNSDDTDENTQKGKKKFILFIPYDKYTEFKPNMIQYKDNSGIRSYNVLKQNAWSDIINDSFLSVYKLPCNFVYKRCKVRMSSDSQYFLHFEAKCKDCNNDLQGFSYNEPTNGQTLELEILTTDTQGQSFEHTSKRQLKGDKRKLVGSQLTTDLA